MDESKYFTEHVRCYADGRVERSNPKSKTPKWRPANIKPQSTGYFRIGIDGKGYFVHRIIAACFLGLDIENLVDVIDHRDGNPINNRVANLRITTKQGNEWNQVRAKGYCWHVASEKWRASIVVNYKQTHLGLFDTEEQARQAYLAAKLIHHVIPERNYQ